MKLINEAKRMQQLAGILNENNGISDDEVSDIEKSVAQNPNSFWVLDHSENVKFGPYTKDKAFAKYNNLINTDSSRLEDFLIGYGDFKDYRTAASSDDMNENEMSAGSDMPTITKVEKQDVQFLRQKGKDLVLTLSNGKKILISSGDLNGIYGNDIDNPQEVVGDTWDQAPYNGGM